MKNLSLLLTATLLLFLTSTYADGPQGQFHHNNQTVRQYVQAHIMPVLKEKRALVETELTTAEKEELTRDRAALKQLYQQQKEQMQQKPEGITMHEYMRSDEQRELSHQFHQQVREIIEKAQAIANNHLPTLDNIHNGLEPSREQWKNDISKLREAQKQNQTEGQTQNQAQNQLASRSEMHPGMYGGGMRPALFEGKDAYAHFLLMPAQSAQTSTNTVSNDALDEFQSLLGNESETSTTTGVATTFQLLPNPASNELVTGNDKIPSDNEFKLIDMQGRVAVSLQNIQPAQHINVSQLPGGTYLAQLTGGGQTIENKIVISH